MIHHNVVRGAFVVLGACLLLVAGPALAYDQYSDATNASGRCAQCHGEYRGNQDYVSFVDGADWGANLHGPHADWVAGLCDTCHNSQLGRTVILDQATGNGLLDPVSCVGCHGRDEGGGVSGAGLRQHHWNAGIETCGDANCHPGDSNPAVFTPVGEDVQPPYYGDPDADLFAPDLQQDPCNDLANGISPEEGRFGFGGLDNDGDGDYDTGDSDCAPLAVFLEFFEGEVAGRSGVMLRWKTTAEIDNAGFRLTRVSQRKPPEVIGFVGAQGSDLFGAEYTFLDDAHQTPGAVVYFLEDIDIFGNNRRHGPANVLLPRAVGTPPGRAKH